MRRDAVVRRKTGDGTWTGKHTYEATRRSPQDHGRLTRTGPGQTAMDNRGSGLLHVVGVRRAGPDQVRDVEVAELTALVRHGQGRRRRRRLLRRGERRDAEHALTPVRAPDQRQRHGPGDRGPLDLAGARLPDGVREV